MGLKYSKFSFLPYEEAVRRGKAISCQDVSTPHSDWPRTAH